MLVQLPFIKLYLVHFVIERTLSRIRLEACFQSIAGIPGRGRRRRRRRVKETLAGADLVEKDTMDSFRPIRQLGQRFNPSVDARFHLFRSRSKCFSFRDDCYVERYINFVPQFPALRRAAALVANIIRSDFFPCLRRLLHKTKLKHGIE